MAKSAAVDAIVAEQLAATGAKTVDLTGATAGAAESPGAIPRLSPAQWAAGFAACPPVSRGALQDIADTAGGATNGVQHCCSAAGSGRGFGRGCAGDNGFRPLQLCTYRCRGRTGKRSGAVVGGGLRCVCWVSWPADACGAGCGTGCSMALAGAGLLGAFGKVREPRVNKAAPFVGVCLAEAIAAAGVTDAVARIPTPSSS